MAERKKPVITGYVSPYIKQKIQELVASGKFASESDLISIAVTEWLRDRELKEKWGEERKVK